MTLVVGFDTATDDVAVALVRVGHSGSEPELVSERSSGVAEGGRPRHAARAAAGAGVGWSSRSAGRAVDLMAVGVGPGLVHRAADRPGDGARARPGARRSRSCPVGTLAALARGLGERTGAAARARLAVLDARRGQAFAALYGPGDEELWQPLVALPGELAERVAALPQPPLAAGSGAIRFRA